MRKILRYPYHFWINYLPNHIINKIPVYGIRHFFYRRMMGIHMGEGSSIHLNTFINRSNIWIGRNSVVNRRCYLDGRGRIEIGDNVSISPEVHLITASHKLSSPSFEYFESPITIENYVWIGTRAIILPGVKLGEGCVVASGAVVSKDIPAYTVVGGVPAKKIGERARDLHYSCKWMPPFD